MCYWANTSLGIKISHHKVAESDEQSRSLHILSGTVAILTLLSAVLYLTRTRTLCSEGPVGLVDNSRSMVKLQVKLQGLDWKHLSRVA